MLLVAIPDEPVSATAVDGPLNYLDAKLSENNHHFQQDNAGVHAAKESEKYFAGRRTNFLPWPLRSPDLNPMENVMCGPSQAPTPIEEISGRGHGSGDVGVDSNLCPGLNIRFRPNFLGVHFTSAPSCFTNQTPETETCHLEIAKWA